MVKRSANTRGVNLLFVSFISFHPNVNKILFPVANLQDLEKCLVEKTVIIYNLNTQIIALMFWLILCLANIMQTYF